MIGGESRCGYEARGPLSPRAMENLLQGTNDVLHREFPPFDALFVARLQALKIACSWLSAIRKSWGVL